MALHLFLRRRTMTRTMDAADRSLIADILERQTEKINGLEKRVADLERGREAARLAGYPGGD